MIAIYGINSTGSNWLSRMIRRAAREAGLAGEFVVEPWSPNARPNEWEAGGPYYELVGENLDLLGRWPGRNETLTVRRWERVYACLRAFEEQWPDAIGFKTLLWPYVANWMQAWPDVRIVEVRRGLAGWLTCIARKRWEWFARDPWWYGEDVIGTNDPLALPWNYLAEEAVRNGTSERLLPLLRAAHFWRVNHDWRNEHLGTGRVLHTSYEVLYSDWDYEIPRVLEHCGLPVPDYDWLIAQAQPQQRRWNDSPFNRGDVQAVVEIVKETP